MDDSFIKQSGTTDRGKLYEDLNVVSIVLKSVIDDNIQEFALSSNDKDFGNFDDIVFETKSGELIQKYALQLKYCNSSKCLTLAHLTGDKGDFALSKYLPTYKKMSESCDKFIIFTNRTVDNWDEQEVLFKKQNFSVKISKEDVVPLINNSRATGSCYKFTNIQSTISDSLSEEQQQYKKFFENLYLYTNQANAVRLEESLSTQFQNEFCCTDEEFKRYKEYIFKWSIREGRKEKLKKLQMKRVIAFCVLFTQIQPFVFGAVNRRIKWLQQAISAFEVTVFKKDARFLEKRIWGDSKMELQDRLEDVNQIGKRYQFSFGHIQNISELNDEDSTKLLWLLGICPLIVTASRAAYAIIQLCNTDKFVLLRNSVDEEELQDRCIFESLADLNPTSDVYKMITRTLKYSIQGKEECLLESLLEQNRDFREDVSTDDLLILSEKTRLVGGEEESLPTPYISRFLTRNIIDTSYLKTVDDDTIVVIDFLSRNDGIRRLLRNFNLIEVNDSLSFKKSGSVKSGSSSSFTKIDRNADLTASTSGPDLYIAQNECSREDFETICRLKNRAEKFHQFRTTDDGNFEWIRSQSAIDGLQHFHLEHGSNKESRLFTISDKINLIVGEPGMGKSVLMRNLKNHIPSNLWTVMFRTEDKLSLFPFLNERNMQLKTFEDYLLNVKYAGLASFDKKVLKTLIQENRVVYIWDAIDEITAHDLELITNIILQLFERNVIQWVTCRIHLKKHLERKFNVYSQNIIPFTEKQQFIYIEKRLKIDDSTKLQSQVEKIKNLIVHQDVFGIPLQIFMLTEVFRENPNKYSDLSEDTFNITDLYEIFIDEKFFIYYRKYFMDIARQNLEQLLGDFRRRRFTYYQNAALRVLVGDSIAQEFDDCQKFLEEIRDNGDPVGIIIEVTADCTPHFIHKSFAEYLVALYFVEHSNSKNFRDTIFENTKQNIRFLFDLLMAKDSSANVAVLYKNINTLEAFGDELGRCKDLGKRNVLQMACSWGQQYPTFPVSLVDSTYIIDTTNEKDFSVVEEDPRYVQMLLYVLNKCEVSEQDELFKYDSMEYAEKTKSLFARAILLQKYFEIPRVDDSLASVLYYSAKFGYVEFIKMFKSFPFIKTQDGSTYLHLSVCQEDFLLQLLNFEVYKNAINDQDANGLTALAKACQNGQYIVVQHLLIHGADVNIPSKDGRTPLHHACQFGNYEIALCLLEAGTDVNIEDDTFWTPLNVACSNGHLEVANLLLERGADATLENNDGWTSFDSACINGHDRIVDLLINSGFDVNFYKKIRNTEDWTILHSASWHGHDNVVRILLELGMNSNISAKLNKTPLHLACEKGHEKVVRLLCEYGTEVNVATDEGWTPLHLASNNAYYSIVQILIDAGSFLDVPGSEGWTPLHLAAFKGHTKIAKLLLESGAPPESVADDGRTPLHHASQLGHEQMVKLFMKHNCNVNFPDLKGLTPLHLSCKEQQDKVVKILIECKSDVNALTEKKKTALHYACKYGHDDAVRLLLIFKAEIEAEDIKGRTPLHLACTSGHEKIVRLLIVAQVDVNRTSKDGWMALHYACRSGHFKIAKLLTSSRADVDSKIAHNGWTALYLASRSGHHKIVDLLLECGASIDSKTNTGKTALHVAAEKNHYRIAWTLINLKTKIDSCDNAKWTPLHVACKLGHLEIVQLLVTSGANMNAATENGWTPLHLIGINGKSKICEQLLKYSEMIDIDALDEEKRTPLYLACQNGHEIICQLLLEAEARISARAKNGSSVLHAACRHGNKKVVVMLQKMFEDLNVIKDARGRTPLHCACENGHPEIVKVLIDRDADVNVKDVDGKTPLHDACEKGHVEVVEILLAEGAKINVSTNWEVTPLYLASRNGHEKIVALIEKELKEKRCCVVLW